jgi:hypothetical protein
MWWRFQFEPLRFRQFGFLPQVFFPFFGCDYALAQSFHEGWFRNLAGYRPLYERAQGLSIWRDECIAVETEKDCGGGQRCALLEPAIFGTS